MDAHKPVDSMAPKSDLKWSETSIIWPNTAFGLWLHPFRATTILGSHKNQFAPSLHSAPLHCLRHLVPITTWSYIVQLNSYCVSHFLPPKVKLVVWALYNNSIFTW